MSYFDNIRTVKDDPTNNAEQAKYLKRDPSTGELLVKDSSGGGGLTNTELRATPVPVSGTVTATPSGTQDVNVLSTVEVEIKNDSGNPIPAKDDFADFEAQHVTLVGSTDTTITFSTTVSLVRVINWDTNNRVLIKNGVIASDVDASATRVGKAPAADVPGSRTLPFNATSIHLRSAGASEVTVEGYRRA